MKTNDRRMSVYRFRRPVVPPGSSLSVVGVLWGLALVFVAVALMTGCASGPEAKVKQCSHYAVIYETYTATVGEGLREASKEEVIAATAAAAFLRAYCGWTPTRGLDENGVPILVPPWAVAR